MSLFVADTHALAWYFTGAGKLGSEALDVFRASASGRGLIVVPTIVLAELMWISEKKRIGLEFHELVDRIEASQNFEVYPFDMEVLRTAERIRSIPELHDRIVVATAMLVGAKVLSKDEDLRQSGIVEVVWQPLFDLWPGSGAGKAWFLTIDSRPVTGHNGRHGTRVRPRLRRPRPRGRQLPQPVHRPAPRGQVDSRSTLAL